MYIYKKWKYKLSNICYQNHENHYYNSNEV